MTVFTSEQQGEIRKIIREEVDRKRRDERRKSVTDEVTTGIKHFASGEGGLQGFRDKVVGLAVEEVARKIRM